MDATHGQCTFCGADNSYERTDCHECGTRLPWADDAGAAKTDTPSFAEPSPAAQQSAAEPPAEPDIRISMPSQWLPPEPLAQPQSQPQGVGPRPFPTVVVSGGAFSRNCCCGCLLLLILFTLLPLSCAVVTGGVSQVDLLPPQSEIIQPARPR